MGHVFHSYVSLPEGKTPGKWNFLTCWISLWGSPGPVIRWMWTVWWPLKPQTADLARVPWINSPGRRCFKIYNLVLVHYLYLFFPCSWWVLAWYVWIRWSGHDELGISPRSISIHIWVQFDFIGCYMAMIIGLCLFQLRGGMQWYQHNYYYIYDSMLLICS